MEPLQSTLNSVQIQSVERFLNECHRSTSHAYEALKGILFQLQNPMERRQARQFLSHIRSYLLPMDSEKVRNEYGFCFDELKVTDYQDEERNLLLLQLPSIFAPEEWSFTFYEGLSRYPSTQFRGKIMSELGSGNGWISIAMAIKYLPEKIYGLDINPRAQICGRINLYLNGLDAFGAPIFDQEGKTVLDRVEFYTSDLLGYCRENQIFLDGLIGCIPQVLNPEGTALDAVVYENDSDEDLYNLSNYCGQQGYIEDQFGLGLIARTLDEAVDQILPGGLILLNMGGRPGGAVLDRLFERRGFEIKKIWQRKIFQADDTDIAPLVEIEAKSPHRFEFFMGLNSEEPISAQTAMYYAQSGGSIAHSLTVYECRLPRQTQIQHIIHLLRSEEYADAKSALDLHFTEEDLADEKIAFLSSLAKRISSVAFFPYGHTEGDTGLRSNLAEFLRSYYHIPCNEQNFLIAPSLSTMVRNISWIFPTKKILADRDFIRDLSPQALQNTTVLESVRSTSLLLELMQKLKPDLLIIKLAEAQLRQADAWVRLVQESERLNIRLFVDISPILDLSSNPDPNGVFTFLESNPLPPNVAILCGLIRNKVYADLELAFMYSENATLLEAMAGAAEYTYSRSPYLNQKYYADLVYELLKFQIPHKRRQVSVRSLQTEAATFKKKVLPYAKNALLAFEHPSMIGSKWPLNAQTKRLDYGENELSAPSLSKVRIFESYARQYLSPEEINPDPEIKTLLHQRFGIDTRLEGSIVYGHGIAPLFSALCEYALQQNVPILFPEGSYGYFYGAAQFHGNQIVSLKTSKENNFLLQAEVLKEASIAYPGGIVFLNAPCVNPTGQLYTSEQLSDLVKASSGLRMVLDTIFTGLEYASQSTSPYKLEEFFTSDAKDVVILGGISKEFSAGGLRLGYAYTRSKGLRDFLLQTIKSQPHATLKFTAKKLWQAFVQKEPTLLSELEGMGTLLKQRADTLKECLESNGWTVLPPSGGLFLVASPTGFSNLKWKNAEGTLLPLDATHLPEALFNEENILINNDVWTGIQGYCRFVLSVEEKVFQEALLGLSNFYKKITSNPS